MSYAYMPPNITTIYNDVRRLSSSQGTNQLSDADIQLYMNSFYLYDLPAKFRSLKLKDKYTFNTIAGIDTYPFDSEHYTTVEMPCYCSKREIQLFTDPWSFYGVNFNWQNVQTLTTCNGTSGPYTGTCQGLPVIRSVNNDPGPLGTPNVSFPIGRNQNILITANISLGNTINVTDDGQGNLIQYYPYAVGQAPFNQQAYQTKYGPQYYRFVVGTINYATGAVAITNFVDTAGANLATTSGNIIQIQYNSQVMNIPLSIMFYQNQFVMRPVPDRGYTIELMAYRSPVQALLGAPTSLGGTGDGITELSEWWETLSVGAARKIYQKRLDTDGMQIMDAQLKERYSIIETRTYAQLGSQRIGTIFADQLSNNYGSGNGFSGSLR